MGPKKWKVLAQNIQNITLARELASQLQIKPIIAEILINRGVDTVEKGQKFLFATLEDLASPWELSDLKEAVARILQALELKEHILVYGDYDVDGITGTALLTSVLKQMGGDVSYYIPHRFQEGYGLNKKAIERAKKEAHVDLIITVDCGIASRLEVDFGRELGLDFIITDHHEPGDLVPTGVPVINPKIQGTSEVRDLAGVGVAFKLAQALCEAKGLPTHHGIYCGDNLDLVTLGTIADVVPLLGENRILVKYGLPLLRESQRPGIKALIEVSGLTGKDLTTGQVAFALAPRINAAGRLGNATSAVELLLTTSEQKAWELAKKLHGENEKRQLIETQIYNEVCEKIEKEIDLTKEKVIVLASPLWHAGVIGIVASKITERYHRPTILLTVEGEEARGSGRSIPGFNLFKALEECQQILVRYGGHSQAAGLTVRTEDIPVFKELINHYGEKILTPQILTPVLPVDCEMTIEEIDENLYQQLQLLQPFGYGNPEPLLCCRNVKVSTGYCVGKNKNHLKLQLHFKEEKIDAIGFNLGHLFTEYGFKQPITLDLAFALGLNEWQGNTNLQLKIADLHFSAPFSGFDFNIKLDLSAFLDKLLVNSQLGRPSLVQVPLRRLQNAFNHLLQRHLHPYGVKIRRVEGFKNGKEPAELSGNDVFITTEAYGCQFLETLGINSVEMLDYRQLLGSLSEPSEVLDYRNTDKLGQLEKLVSLEEYLVVYLNYRTSAQKLVDYLEKNFPQLKGKVKLFFDNDDLSPELFDPQETRVLLTDQFLEFYHWPYTQWRVLFEPPFSLEELGIHLRGGSDSPLYLLWSEEDLLKNSQVLEALFPEEQFLTELLTYGDTLGENQPLNMELLAKKLNLAGNGWKLKLYSGLKILYELGIIEWKKGTYIFTDMKGPVIFDQSPYYSDGQKELRAWSEFFNLDFPWKKLLGVG